MFLENQMAAVKLRVFKVREIIFKSISKMKPRAIKKLKANFSAEVFL